MSLIACDSWLDVDPSDQYSTETFWKTKEHASAGIMGCYNALKPWRSLHTMEFDMLTANAMPYNEANGTQAIGKGEHLSTTALIGSLWKNCYVGIGRTNTFIANVGGVDMDESEKAKMVGEAKFLRAFYYLSLVDKFGGVPLIIDAPNADEQAELPRNSKEEVVNQIVKDLEEAAAVLPDTYASSDLGRATKGAAKILAGKVYLTKGDYSKAKEKLAEVVEQEGAYGYGLHVEYGDNWNLDTEAGKEAVFYIEYKADPLPHNDEMSLTGPKYSLPEPIGVSGSNEADIPTMELNNTFKENDKRKAVNLRTHYTNPVNGKELISSIPLFGKYWQDGLTAIKFCEINMHIIRYSDALLMYAEALNEIGESEKAHQVLNRVRERAFGDSSENYEGLSKDAFRAAVLQERYLEFPIEGHRWFDLVRTGTFIKRMKEHSTYEAKVAEKNKTDIASNIKDYMILMPIPQRELDLNPELTQNPGWS